MKNLSLSFADQTYKADVLWLQACTAPLIQIKTKEVQLLQDACIKHKDITVPCLTMRDGQYVALLLPESGLPDKEQISARLLTKHNLKKANTQTRYEISTPATTVKHNPYQRKTVRR